MRGLLLLGAALTLAACDPAPPVAPVEPVDTATVELGYASAPWPSSAALALAGEVSGIDIDAHGHVFVFHRSTRGWDTLTPSNIPEPTVLMLDAASGNVLAAWGANQFRLPHGLTVDAAHNVWLTDAARHQVFQFSHDGVLLRSWGSANVAGWDATHFNRPTDVSIRADGGFYVSDGYENQRVAQFAADGKYLREWGANLLRLPHMITASAHRIYVADRENERIAQFDSTGTLTRSLRPLPNVWVYSTAIDSTGRIFAALRNDGLGLGRLVRLNGEGAIDLTIGGEIPALHDLAVGTDGAIYSAETRPGGLRKFRVVRGR